MACAFASLTLWPSPLTCGEMKPSCLIFHRRMIDSPSETPSLPYPLMPCPTLSLVSCLLNASSPDFTINSLSSPRFSSFNLFFSSFSSVCELLCHEHHRRSHHHHHLNRRLRLLLHPRPRPRPRLLVVHQHRNIPSSPYLSQQSNICISSHHPYFFFFFYHLYISIFIHHFSINIFTSHFYIKGGPALHCFSCGSGFGW